MRVKRLGMTVLAGCILLFGALNVVLVLQVHVSTLEADMKEAAADWPLSALHSLYFTSARSLLPFAESNSFLISPGASTSEEEQAPGLTEDDEEDDAGEGPQEPIQEPVRLESQQQSDLEEDDRQALQVEGDLEGEPEGGGGGEEEVELDAAEEPQEVQEAAGGAVAAEEALAAVSAQQAVKMRERTFSRRVNERKKAAVAPALGTTGSGTSGAGRGKGRGGAAPPPPPPAPVAVRKGQMQNKKKRPRP